MLNERGIADTNKLKPIARLSGISYGRVSEGFELPRLAWADKGEEIERTLSQIHKDQAHL